MAAQGSKSTQLFCDDDSDVIVVVDVGAQGLMRELELREKKMNDVQATGDKLLRDGHPARTTIEVNYFTSQKS